MRYPDGSLWSFPNYDETGQLESALPNPYGYRVVAPFGQRAGNSMVVEDGLRSPRGHGLRCPGESALVHRCRGPEGLCSATLELRRSLPRYSRIGGETRPLSDDGEGDLREEADPLGRVRRYEHDGSGPWWVRLTAPATSWLRIRLRVQPDPSNRIQGRSSALSNTISVITRRSDSTSTVR